MNAYTNVADSPKAQYILYVITFPVYSTLEHYDFEALTDIILYNKTKFAKRLYRLLYGTIVTFYGGSEDRCLLRWQNLKTRCAGSFERLVISQAWYIKNNESSA